MVLEQDSTDHKLLKNFEGLVVKKKLSKDLKDDFKVPLYVLEALLLVKSAEKECINNKKIRQLKKDFKQKFFSSREKERKKALIKEAAGKVEIIDEIKVKLYPSEDKYWASLSNINIKKAHVTKNISIENHDKLFYNEGIWAFIDIIYNKEKNKYPFIVKNIDPIQLSTFPEDKIKKIRDVFSLKEWKNVLLRSIGIEPEAKGMNDKVILLHLSRLLPLIEKNFNMIEIGPRGIGKSFLYKNISPFSRLISGSSVTVPQLFLNNKTNETGLVGSLDAVAFDEITDIKFKDSEGPSIMKDYMESGSFSRGNKECSGEASMVFLGNTKDNLAVQTENIFEVLPKKMKNTAFLDRIHFLLPGWEIMKYSEEHLTDHFGFSLDFLLEFLKYKREESYMNEVEKYFNFSSNSHLNKRDSKAVKKIISGFIKLFHPCGKFNKKDIENYLKVALEMRRKVKLQQKEISKNEEYDKTNFSYIDKETQKKVFPFKKTPSKIIANPKKEEVLDSHSLKKLNLELINYIQRKYKNKEIIINETQNDYNFRLKIHDPWGDNDLQIDNSNNIDEDSTNNIKKIFQKDIKPDSLKCDNTLYKYVQTYSIIERILTLFMDIIPENRKQFKHNESHYIKTKRLFDSAGIKDNNITDKIDEFCYYYEVENKKGGSGKSISDYAYFNYGGFIIKCSKNNDNEVKIKYSFSSSIKDEFQNKDRTNYYI